MGKKVVVFASLIALALLTSCGTNPPARVGEQEMDLSRMTYAADREVLTVEEFPSLNPTSALSTQSDEYPDLTDTKGVSVAFSHKFADGFQIDFHVTDGVVSSGDTLIGSYGELLEGIQKYEASLKE